MKGTHKTPASPATNPKCLNAHIPLSQAHRLILGAEHRHGHSRYGTEPSAILELQYKAERQD